MPPTINHLAERIAALAQTPGVVITASDIEQMIAGHPVMSRQSSLEHHETRIRELESDLAGAQQQLKFHPEHFPKHQATTCGRCGVYKHTPWRDDEFGYGYVCATCLSAIHAENTKALRDALRWTLPEAKANRSLIHPEDWPSFDEQVAAAQEALGEPEPVGIGA